MPPQEPQSSVPPYGIGGIGRRGTLFGPPTVQDWVDVDKAPGTTDQRDQLGLRKTARSVATLSFFFKSPNLVWFLMALTSYVVFPYDVEGAAASKGVAGAHAWLVPRFALNVTIAFAYYFLFFYGLYLAGWGERKYKDGSFPTAANMAHNMWYWVLGVVQWTFLELVVCRAWASGYAAQYATFEEILADPKLVAWNMFWILAIPVWRDLHFYIAHRFVHIRAIYKYVHSLHHRNDDPEPFSGITMHPVEHLYYYSNAFTPSLYLTGLSPLVFLWNFIHLTIAPAAGHSGWEDNFQSDQYHYVHHAKFECNYGSPMSAFIDQYFGTFREKLGESVAYKGQWQSAEQNVVDDADAKAIREDKKEKIVWSRQGHLGLPADLGHGIYTAYWVYLFGLVYWGTVANHDANNGGLLVESVAFVPTPQFVAVQTAFGPIAVALALCKIFKDRCNWRWPFQKEPVFGAFGLFIVLGFFACILPTYHAVLYGCSPA